MEDTDDGKTEKKLDPCDAETKIMNDGERLKRVAEILSKEHPCKERINEEDESTSTQEKVTFYCGEKPVEVEEIKRKQCHLYSY